MIGAGNSEAAGRPGGGPTVSCITIFWNAERFLAEAVESVLTQTFTNWELLLVDDGSTDRSGEIARGYAERHPDRVRYMSHPGGVNRGMSASRNLGLRSARGKFVAFLDADDVWLPHKLERQVPFLEHDERLGLVFGPSLVWFSWEENDGRPDRLRPAGVAPRTRVEPPDFLVSVLRRRAHTPATCSVLVRRSAAETVGGFDDRFSGMYEDQVFFAKLFLRTPSLALEEYLDRYRQHPDSHCSLSQREGLYSGFAPNRSEYQFLKWLESYLQAQGVRNEVVWRALRKATAPYLRPRLYAPAVWLSRTRHAVLERLGTLAYRALPRPAYHRLMSWWYGAAMSAGDGR